MTAGEGAVAVREARTFHHLQRIDDDLVEYEVAMDRMQSLVEARVRGDRGDTLWLLSHPPVFTVGRRTAEDHLPAQGVDIPVVRSNRGGQLTYHAPGQLVGYLIVELGIMLGTVDFVRQVELRLCDALGELGVDAERRDTPAGAPLLTGVWTTATQRKIASIGVRCARGVTSHGFALNVDCDLRPWGLATPCGMSDVDMTSVQRELAELGHPVPDFATVRHRVAEAFGAT